jgi:hypothetical protein
MAPISSTMGYTDYAQFLEQKVDLYCYLCYPWIPKCGGMYVQCAQTTPPDC